MRKLAVVGIVLSCCFSAGLQAQEDEFFHSEANVSAIGTFNDHSTGNGIRQGSSDSGGVLANYRFLFTKHQGVEIDYSFFKDSQHYTRAVLPPSFAYGVHTTVNEVTANYVYRMPMGRFVPYLSGGTGAVVFDPGPMIQGYGPIMTTTHITGAPGPVKIPQPVTSVQPKATFVYGAGVDLKITTHLSFRAGYRGLIYKAPAFNTPPLLKTGAMTHLAEPVGGLTFRF
jgi:outer membrane immunogenic protein